MILSEFEPLQERFRLIFIDALDLFDCQLNTAHASNLSKRSGIATQQIGVRSPKVEGQNPKSEAPKSEIRIQSLVWRDSWATWKRIWPDS